MGKLVEIKTKPTSSGVAGFIDSISDEQKRKDSHVILKLMEKACYTATCKSLSANIQPDAILFSFLLLTSNLVFQPPDRQTGWAAVPGWTFNEYQD